MEDENVEKFVEDFFSMFEIVVPELPYDLTGNKYFMDTELPDAIKDIALKGYVGNGEGLATLIAGEIAIGSFTSNDKDEDGKKVEQGITQGIINKDLDRVKKKITELQDEIESGRFFKQAVFLDEYMTWPDYHQNFIDGHSFGLEDDYPKTSVYKLLNKALVTIEEYRGELLGLNLDIRESRESMSRRWVKRFEQYCRESPKLESVATIVRLYGFIDADEESLGRPSAQVKKTPIGKVRRGTDL